MRKEYCVLFYNRMWNQNLDFTSVCIPNDFFFTTDHCYVEIADAIVFHMPSLALGSEFSKNANQLWVFWSMECDVNYPHLYNKEVLQWFDILMTYKSDSEVQVPYLLYEHKDKLRQAPIKKTEFVNAFVSSSLNHSGRQEYLKSLMMSIKIDSYGRFLKNRNIERDSGLQAKMEIISKYKFTLAFENAIGSDYVTEKLFDPLIAGSVPVYLGAPNVDEYLPADKCIINVNSFKSAAELAEYLRYLDSNEAVYSDYLTWKQFPYKAEFLDRLEKVKSHVYTRLCDLIKRKIKQRTYGSGYK